jgi:hypothetical protein
MDRILFSFYYVGLRLGTFLTLHETANPLDIKWRWNNWQHRRFMQRRYRSRRIELF